MNSRFTERAQTTSVSEPGIFMLSGLDHFTNYEIKVQAVYSAMYCHKGRVKFGIPAIVGTRPLREYMK